MTGRRVLPKKFTAARTSDEIVVRALHTTQGNGTDVYAFFIHGSDIVRVADISRVGRDDTDTLKGFQRPEIRSHVKGIVEYLNQGQVLFPNAIILALSPAVHFAASRGTRPTGDEGIAQSGTLTIPVYEEGKRVAWIVDGQQRSLALARAESREIAVPVIGFVSDRIDVQREQFILVNKAKPLPTRLINELLPETGGLHLPRELSVRKVPSELCSLLNRDPASPFHQLIKRPSDGAAAGKAVVTDSAVITMIRNSINNPLGALATFRLATPGRESADLENMYRLLVTFWSAVKAVFPEAWGRDPRHSRLMHSAGILAMGVLMDRIYARVSPHEDVKSVQRELQKVASSCRWTRGTWDSLGVAWNEIQNTTRDIRRLQTALVQAYIGGGEAP
ncbi:DGQHR domain-containing protein DpdB [Ramlibacter alkalitolerans]|uniref:DGQHR domain-containing protein n=1 Tax=Ramlibacter alkalitolerans TaxID=2039631 RepID=A0ABS1JUS5_9BURK|nr:DGQHR domain-containing protein DpdB [Ramlibacter alkalitolerans]MBL0427972.1 DGQHR domain-containing protein [Ramlibacter alkalitolerans]